MQVNTSIVNSIAINLNTIDGNINDIIDNIINECTNIDNNWDGLASEEYNKNLLNSIKTFKTYSYELESAIGILNQLLNDTSEIEKKNLEIINNSFSSSDK